MKSNIHVLSAVNSKNITRETIDNEPHLIIKGVVPIVDDVVMNGGLYPADEINKGYKTLEGNFMPLGHPEIEGSYISAQDVRAVNKHHVGAWASNARKENGRVLVDMCINIRFAEGSENGKRLLSRLDEMESSDDAEPIHVSTGLILNKVVRSGKSSNGKKYQWIATNMFFDHIAILLDEPGAATPNDGVGIFVNQDGAKLDVERVNLNNAADCRKERLFDKVRWFFTANSAFSFDEIYRALSEQLNPKNKEYYRYIESVYPDYFIYEDQGKRFKQSYLINDDGLANFVGEPVEVVKKVEYHTITANEENQQMRGKIINALNAAGVKTEGLDDDQLLAAYNKLQEDKAKSPDGEKEKPKDEEKPTDKTKKGESEDEEDLDKKIEKAVNKAFEAKMNANQESELATKRSAVKAHFGLDETAVNSLSNEALNGLYAKTVKSTAVNAAFNGNTVNDDLLNMEAPE